jgi:GxxExxY protein
MTDIVRVEPPRREGAKRSEPTRQHDIVAGQIVDSAFAVHNCLGPGLLESVYEQCLLLELNSRNLKVERQVAVPVTYRGTLIEAGFRMDMVVEKLIVIEIKAVEKIAPVHEAQLLTYMKLSGLTLGMLINFNVPRIKDGLRRLVHS